MKASELIERLQELIELHGDLSIGISIYDWGNGFDRCANAYYVDYDTRYKEFCIH